MKWFFIAIVILMPVAVYGQTNTPYINESFNGVLANPNIWFSNPCPSGVSGCAAPQTFPFPPDFTFVSDGNGNQAIQVFDCASSSGSNLCEASSSSSGHQNGMSTHYAVHAGYACGTGTSPLPNCENVDDGNGMQEETWYRFHVRLPTGYQPTPGQQNALFELHVDKVTEADAAATGGITAYSTALQVGADFNDPACPGTPKFCTSAGANPYLFLQIPGGLTSCGALCRVVVYRGASNSLLINHWYDIVLHIIWSMNPSVGYVQLWIDDVQLVDKYMATHYKRSNGTESYGETLGFFNYPLWANFSITDQFENAIWGPTPGSINFISGTVPSPPTGLTATVQ